MLQEILPYEGDEILGIYASPDLAKAQKPGLHFIEKEDADDGDAFWTTSDGTATPFFLISKWDVEGQAPSQNEIEEALASIEKGASHGV